MATEEEATPAAKPLRPYQRDCVRAVNQARKGGLTRVLYSMPTGTGKTRTFTEILTSHAKPGRSALVLAHRDELLTQAAGSVKEHLPGVDVAIERGPDRAHQGAHVIVASVQTLARANCNRLDWLAKCGPSVMVYDEAHHIAADGAQGILARFGAYDGRTFLVGCTATPKRLDKKALVGPAGKATFESHVYNYGILDAIKDGWLTDIKGYRVVTETDLSDVATRGGDFAPGELARAVDNEARTWAALEEWAKVAEERPTICFCAGVEHAEHAAETWRKAGYTAAVVHGGMEIDARRETIARFKTGEIQVLANCEVLTEGFDYPAVSCIVLLRPTQSWGLYVQMAGRGTRLSPETGKTDLILLDVVDNTTRHSLCTAASILDLPAKIDLQGKSLTEAKDALDEMEERRGYLPGGYEPATFDELIVTLEKVNVFAAVTPPEEVATASSLHWLKAGSIYRLSAGAFADGTKRVAVLRSDALGDWSLELTRFGEAPERYPWCGSGDVPDFAYADETVQHEWPDAGALVNTRARWRSDPPTEKQAAILRRNGISDEVISGLTKGQASSMLDQIFASGGGFGTRRNGAKSLTGARS